MPIENKSFTLSVSADGVADMKETVDVPQGEIWYVDTFAILTTATEGLGFEEYQIAFGILPGDLTTSDVSSGNLKETLSGTHLDPSSGGKDEIIGAATTTGIGAYAYGGQTLAIGEDADNSNGSYSCEAYLEIRRIV